MRWEYLEYEPHSRLYKLIDDQSLVIKDIVKIEQCGDTHRVITLQSQTVVITNWKYWKIIC